MRETEKMNPVTVNKNRANKTEASMANTYATTDLSLSAFLQARGHEIVNIRNQNGRGTFVFSDTQELREDLLRWGNNKPVSIRVRVFVNGMRDLKGLVGV